MSASVAFGSDSEFSASRPKTGAHREGDQHRTRSLSADARHRDTRGGSLMDKPAVTVGRLGSPVEEEDACIAAAIGVSRGCIETPCEASFTAHRYIPTASLLRLFSKMGRARSGRCVRVSNLYCIRGRLPLPCSAVPRHAIAGDPIGGNRYDADGPFGRDRLGVHAGRLPRAQDGVVRKNGCLAGPSTREKRGPSCVSNG